ncbi:pyruvate kinase [Rhizobium sp. SSA_523]|uniref:pyruvate kinase n=1 Tax=Rhizobium sp. SSA_523 TaxID=2952477 RepID=UPI0020916BC3|nr:pyruvate kinase [Rhizobium sp. SSA_523]MCO5732042.1 pyruvate kinase [Rhizobium sp. SSA_523]WKC22620.1 pyruvate kinase [Rhizobium sp. SSA_523]
MDETGPDRSSSRKAVDPVAPAGETATAKKPAARRRRSPQKAGLAAPKADPVLQALLEEVQALREAVLAEAEPWLEAHAASPLLKAEDRTRLRNLGHYLSLRRHDLRPLQRRLMAAGFSSLGRAESRVLPTIDAVLASLAAASAAQSTLAAPGMIRPSEAQFFEGEMLLDQGAARLLGPAPAHRRCRIMVTLPAQAADDPDLLLDLVRRGTNIVRINCAHDDRAAWMSMAAHARAAGQALDVPVSVLMDIAGPKIRTGAVVPEKKGRLQVGDLLRLVAEGDAWLDEGITACACVSVPEIVTRLKIGDRLRYDDGKLEGVVESLAPNQAVIRVTHCKTGGAKLKPEKGLNLPDTLLGLSPLTPKDEEDLATVVECADMLGYSFVSRADDIDLLEDALKAAPPRQTPLGLVAKIEQPEAVRNLPALIAAALRYHRPFGVMIARGDLAAEIGFDRTAEMQEEILWICEAASVPVIWATQVLEDLVKTGLPSRGEMTDAAMAARAECVMLNKGPAVTEAVALLDHLLSRMDEHMAKKTPLLRALQSWQD